MLQLRLFAGKTQWQGWPRRDGLGREGHSRTVHGRNGDSDVGCWSRRELCFESWEQRRLQSQRTHQLHCFLPAKKFVKKNKKLQTVMTSCCWHGDVSKWNVLADILAAGTSDGHVAMWKYDDSEFIEDIEKRWTLQPPSTVDGPISDLVVSLLPFIHAYILPM